MIKKVLLTIALLIMVVLPATPAFADDGKVLFGEDFVLESGEEYIGDVVVFDGKLVLKEGSHLKGDAVVFGQSALVAGYLEGDLVVFGDDVKIESTGTIEGDVVAFGGEIVREEGATIEGQQTEMPFFGWVGNLPWTQLGYLSFAKGGPGFRYFDIFTSLAFSIFRFFLTLLALMAVGIVIILFWPAQVERVGETVLKAPLASGGVGLAAIVLGIPVGLVLIVAACLGLVVWLALFVAALFGFVAIASLVGERLLKALNFQGVSPIPAMLLGVLVLRLLSWVPCLGFILSIIVYSLGLGAVILTRFGTQPYPQPTITAITPQGEES